MITKIDDPALPYFLLQSNSTDPEVARQEWLAERATRVTASDIAGICGKGAFSWTSPKRVQDEKFHGGNYDGRPAWGKQPMYWGKKNESSLLEFFAEVEGMKIAKSVEDLDPTETMTKGAIVTWPEYCLVVSREYPWLACTPDAMLFPKGNMHPEGWEPLECKCTASQRMFEDTTKPPAYHNWQCQTQLIVLGKPRLHLIALVGGNDTRRVDPFGPDPAVVDQILAESREFYQKHIVERIPVAE